MELFWGHEVCIKKIHKMETKTASARSVNSSIQRWWKRGHDIIMQGHVTVTAATYEQYQWARFQPTCWLEEKDRSLSLCHPINTHNGQFPRASAHTRNHNLDSRTRRPTTTTTLAPTITTDRRPCAVKCARINSDDV